MSDVGELTVLTVALLTLEDSPCHPDSAVAAPPCVTRSASLAFMLVAWSWPEHSGCVSKGAGLLAVPLLSLQSSLLHVPVCAFRCQRTLPLISFVFLYRLLQTFVLSHCNLTSGKLQFWDSNVIAANSQYFLNAANECLAHPAGVYSNLSPAREGILPMHPTLASSMAFCCFRHAVRREHRSLVAQDLFAK